MNINNQLNGGTSFNRQALLSAPPAVTAAKATPAAAVTPRGTSTTEQSQVLRGTKADVLSFAVLDNGGKPPVTPTPGNGTVTRIELNPLTLLCDLIDGGIQDLEEVDDWPGIVEGIIDFINKLPKPQ